MRKSALLLTSAFAVLPGCFSQEAPETSKEVVNPHGSMTMVVPVHADITVRTREDVAGCTALGDTVTHDIENDFWWLRKLGNPDSLARALGEQAREQCEEDEMRADCQRVKERVRSKTLSALQEAGAGRPGTIAGKESRDAEEGCLAGYGLVPENTDS